MSNDKKGKIILEHLNGIIKGYNEDSRLEIWRIEKIKKVLRNE